MILRERMNMKKILSLHKAPHPHWVGDGFPVKTLFSYQAQGNSISPFLLLDHAGPMEFSPTAHRRGVGEHPHRGFETVTIVYQGEVAHKDSTNERGLIGPGDMQWMTAGQGILHEEFHSEAFARDGGMLEMMQLWVNLPKRDKMTKPRYQTITAAQIPQIDIQDKRGSLRIIAGEVSGVTGPAKTYSPIIVMDGFIKAAGHYEHPIKDGWTVIVVIRKGQVKVNHQLVSAGQTIVLSHEGLGLVLEAIQDSEVFIMSGEPINEPIVGHGPFVMNSAAEISQAMTDFQAGKFGQLNRI